MKMEPWDVAGNVRVLTIFSSANKVFMKTMNERKKPPHSHPHPVSLTRVKLIMVMVMGMGMKGQSSLSLFLAFFLFPSFCQTASGTPTSVNETQLIVAGSNFSDVP